MRSCSRIALAALVVAASSARVLAGETWTALRSLPVQPVSIAVDAADPGVVWVAGVVLDPWTEKLMKSTDRGGSWTEVDAGCGRSWFVATDPSSPGTVYASGYGCGLSRSEDGGRTWRTLLGGIRGWVQRLLVHPRLPSTLYAVSDQDDSCGGGACLYRSLDRGETWLRVPAPDSNDPVVLALDPSAPATAFFGSRAGLFRSIDGGTSWTRTGDTRFDSGVNDVVFDPANPAVMYVVGTGLARSADGGRTWASAGLEGQSPISITIDGRSSLPILWAAGGAGAYRSRDLGATWELLRDGIAAYSDVYRFALSAGPAPALYAMTDSGVYSLALDSVPNSYLIPSAARAPGANGAFYTTDLAVANPSDVDAALTIRFLGHDADGRNGPSRAFTLASRRAVTYADVLGSVFGLERDFGALQVTSSSADLRIQALTTTPLGSGGSVGQAVPAFDASRLATAGKSAVLVGLREDPAFRTNLVLANATEIAASVALRLVGPDGSALGAGSLDLPPLGMTQVTSVVTALGAPSGTANAYVVVTVTTPGAAVAAYASVTDNATNDPRTVVP